MPCKFITMQEIRDDAKDARIAYLKRQLAAAGTLPKIPIDYSQSESGQAPFDGDNEYLLKMCDGYVGGAFVLGTWMAGICDAWYTVLGVIPKENACEWMPVPEFMKG